MFKKTNPIDKNSDYEKVIFEMFYHRVYNTAYYIVKDPHLAQDVVQETFIKAFQKINSLEDGNKLGAWLGTITTRTAIDYLRKINRRNDRPFNDVYIDERRLNDQKSSLEEEVENRFLKESIKQNIKTLEPPEYREVIILKYTYDLKNKEIADALNISLSAVKSRLHRAIQKLKGIMTDKTENEGW